jgi:sulfide:quinone oxidoreductase
MKSKIVLVLGGGVGGLVAVNRLRRLLSSEHRVVLVEKNMQHAFAPSFLWLMTGKRKPMEISRRLSELIRAGIEVVQAEVRGIEALFTHARKLERSFRRFGWLVCDQRE